MTTIFSSCLVIWSDVTSLLPLHLWVPMLDCNGATAKCHLPLARMTIVKISTNNKCLRSCEAWEEAADTVGRNVKWYNSWVNYTKIHQKL